MCKVQSRLTDNHVMLFKRCLLLVSVVAIVLTVNVIQMYVTFSAFIILKIDFNNPSWNKKYRIVSQNYHCWCRSVHFLIFLKIYREVLHPLHHEEAECSSEAQDDHQQELPHQQEVTAVEECHRCKNRLTKI